MAGLPLLGALALLPALARAGAAGDLRELKAGGLSVELDGSSTLHPWKAFAQEATLTAEAADAGTGLPRAVAHGGLKDLKLAVEVDGLKSTETSGMDKNMRKALGSDRFPEIRFTLKDYALAGAAVRAHGELEIHGVTRGVELVGALEPGDGGALRVSGSTSLRMSDYGVTPPVLMFGAIRVADAVTVRWSFTLKE